MAPVRHHFTPNMLSLFNKRLHESIFRSSLLCGSSLSSIEKFLITLDDKQNYVLHYRNLKLYMNFGLELKEIYRVLKKVNRIKVSKGYRVSIGF